MFVVFMFSFPYLNDLGSKGRILSRRKAADGSGWF